MMIVLEARPPPHMNAMRERGQTQATIEQNKKHKIERKTLRLEY